MQRSCPRASWMHLYTCTHRVSTRWLEVLYDEIPCLTHQKQSTCLTITVSERQRLQRGIAEQLECQLHPHIEDTAAAQ